MHRTPLTWLLFALCCAVVLAALAHVSRAVLRLEQADDRARTRVAFEEDIRLALWRMESTLAPLIAREAARPYFAYVAFYSPSRAYTAMFNPIDYGEVLVPSVLLTEHTPLAVLHFQVGPDGRLTSPQVPGGNMRDLAEARYVAPERIAAAEQQLRELDERLGPPRLLAAVPRDADPPPRPEPLPTRLDNAPARWALTNASPQEQLAQQVERGQVEYQQRAKSVQASGNTLLAEPPAGDVPHAEVHTGTLAPVWIDDSLILARWVRVNGEEYLQGCVLDWPGIQAALEDAVSDLLPGARLVGEPEAAGEPRVQPAAARGRGSASLAFDQPAVAPTRRLASLPARLLPGRPAGFRPTDEAGALPVASGSLGPIRLSLALAWACVLTAIVAVGALLQGALGLSERRGAFVSAVTHELRTPLTTLRMYAEMLAEGMVRTDDQRRQYLATLRSEADRLGHLVENVLAYARLERGRARARLEETTLDRLIEGVRQRLAQRAEQAGLALELELSADAADAPLRTDAAAVEQILFNLVDNACKYAGGAAQPGAARLLLAAARHGRHAELRICDDGPGIAPADARRLFKPFTKSAREAAHSAPGVGLGLALSRRLARHLGGDLRYEPPAPAADRFGRAAGACFVLMLPLT